MLEADRHHAEAHGREVERRPEPPEPSHDDHPLTRLEPQPLAAEEGEPDGEPVELPVGHRLERVPSVHHAMAAERT